MYKFHCMVVYLVRPLVFVSERSDFGVFPPALLKLITIIEFD